MTKKRRELDHNASLLFEDRTAPPQAGWGDVARFVTEARESLPVEPSDRTRAEHLRAIVAAVVEDRTRATAGSLEPTPRRRTLMDRTKPALARLAVAVATLTGGTAGLAYAGVDLPGQAAEKAFSAVGVELPNQAGETETTETETTETETVGTEEITVTTEHESAVATLVKDVIANRDTYETGCEFGQAVAAAASSNSQGDGGSDQDPCTEGDEGGEGGPSETGATKSSEGKAKAEENKTNAGSDAQGSQDIGTTKSSEGKAKAEEHLPGDDE